MKDRNKKIYIISGILIFLLIITVIIFTIKNNKTSNENNNENNDNEISDEIVENIQSNNYEGMPQVITIKSTKENPIEKDNVEVTNIEIIENFGELQVTTTVKNNTNEILNGFFIEIYFLDKDGNEVTSISEDSEEKVEPNEEFSFYNSVTEIPNGKDIINARIGSLEKSSTKNYIENVFDEMDEEVNKMMEGK